MFVEAVKNASGMIHNGSCHCNGAPLAASSPCISQATPDICFYTEGVKLVCEDSALLERLGELKRKGVHLVVCSTCLGYFGLTDRLRVGIVGGMSDILELQVRVSKVITL